MSAKRKRDHYRKLHHRRRQPTPVLPILGFVAVLVGAALYAHRDTSPSATQATSLAVASGDAVVAQLTTRDAISNAIQLAAHSATPAEPAVAPPKSSAPSAPNSPNKIVGELKPGESLTTALSRLGVSEAAAMAPIRALDGAVDFRRSKPGDRFEVDRDANGRVTRLRFGADAQVWEARATSDGFSKHRISP